MNVLSIDYGDARIGLAKGSQDTSLALPFKTLLNKNRAYIKQQLLDIIEEENIGVILVGLPLNLASKDTIQTQKVRNFILFLKTITDVSIVELDERMTSKLALRSVGRDKVDVESARILLQEWFDKP